MPPEEEEVKLWLAKADRDRRMAEAGLAQTPPITDGAAFHAQQVVEKTLKAYLVFRGHEFEKVHDLETLAGQCAEYDPTFAQLSERVAPLTAFAVRFRYPGPAEPSVDQVRQALVVAAEVWTFVVDRLPPEASP